MNRRTQSGTIRRDPARARGRRDDPRIGEEARRAPADGAPSDCQRDPAGAEEAAREQPKLGPVKDPIDTMLEAIGKRRGSSGTPRIGSGRGCGRNIRSIAIGEPTVRRYVQRRKQELGLGGREVFVPQSYDWGQEGQVDWFEAAAVLGGEARKLQFFAMRSMASGDAFHRAYTNATQQALLEAHEHAFAYFGGVFRTLRYDNMTSR